jgi:hypothetical protein
MADIKQLSLSPEEGFLAESFPTLTFEGPKKW